mgnify:CR=1 FL=1
MQPGALAQLQHFVALDGDARPQAVILAIRIGHDGVQAVVATGPVQRVAAGAAVELVNLRRPDAEEQPVVDDDLLRLVFTCCHPALAMEARVALTLRMVGGLTVPEIARAFLVQDSTIGQRISRAKAKKQYLSGEIEPYSLAA